MTLGEVIDRFVVVLDANVLYPFTVRDALLRFAEAGLFRVRWTADILDEVRRSVLKKNPDLADSLEEQFEAMRIAFPESWIEGYQPLIHGLELPDPDDRHVLAAALRASAQVIVTNNLKDFPTERVGEFNIEAQSADYFIVCTIERYRSQALSALRRMRTCYTNPPYNPSEFLDALRRNNLVETATLIRPDIDMI